MPNSQRKQNKHAHPSLTAQQGLTKHVCKSSGSISRKRREYLGLRAGNMCNLRSCVVKLCFSVGSILGDEYDLILAIRSQIFEYLHKTFCRRALGCLDPARLQKTNCFIPTERLTIVLRSEGLSSVGTRFHR